MKKCYKKKDQTYSRARYVTSVTAKKREEAPHPV